MCTLLYDTMTSASRDLQHPLLCFLFCLFPLLRTPLSRSFLHQPKYPCTIPLLLEPTGSMLRAFYAFCSNKRGFCATRSWGIRALGFLRRGTKMDLVVSNHQGCRDCLFLQPSRSARLWLCGECAAPSGNCFICNIVRLSHPLSGRVHNFMTQNQKKSLFSRRHC